MSGIVVNQSDFSAGLDRYVTRFEQKFRRRVKMLVDEGMRRLLRRTPVHTGEAVMNYIASAGQPAYTNREAPEPVEATNKLTIGTEILRPRAERLALATLATVDFSDPFSVFWITNSTPHISGLEAGELPLKPYKPRSPQGMFGVTLQELIALLESSRL